MLKPRKHMTVTARNKFIAIRLTQEEYDYFKAFTETMGISMSMLIDLSLRAYIDRETRSRK